MAKTVSVPVARRALLARINRKLAHKGRKMFLCRSEIQKSACGDWMVIDMSRKTLVAHGLDMVRFARQLGVMEPYEVLGE
jgi:hypothetical protein